MFFLSSTTSTVGFAVELDVDAGKSDTASCVPRRSCSDVSAEINPDRINQGLLITTGYEPVHANRLDHNIDTAYIDLATRR